MTGGDSPGQVKIEIRPVKVDIEGGEEVRGVILPTDDRHHLDPDYELS